MGDFSKLFSDFGKTDSFDIVPAVRSPTGNCVDEDGCEWEKVTLCAFDQTQDTKGQVDFLVCMDESKGSSATSAGKSCASKGGLDFSTIESCVSGSKSTSLLKAASEKFNKSCPGRTTIPHTFVNGVDTSPSYSAIKSELCKDGSTASVCQQKATECVV